uniref:Uncharacterized protein n=1 Tax=viral metagenome TaxID=1070528 RepID=A0A6H1ZY09_9ZZZZ
MTEELTLESMKKSKQRNGLLVLKDFLLRLSIHSLFDIEAKNGLKTVLSKDFKKCSVISCEIPEWNGKNFKRYSGEYISGAVKLMCNLFFTVAQGKCIEFCPLAVPGDANLCRTSLKDFSARIYYGLGNWEISVGFKVADNNPFQFFHHI